MRKYKDILKLLFIVLSIISILNIGMYVIAYIMKDRANHKYSRDICKQVYEGPKNIINLISKKILNKEIFKQLDINKILEKQSKIEEQIKKEYSELEYSWRHPYIKVNPYEITPLSALIKFKTDEAERVKIEIVDREGTNIVYNFDKYTTEHEYGISGLYSKGITEIKLILENENGKIKKKMLN